MTFDDLTPPLQRALRTIDQLGYFSGEKSTFGGLIRRGLVEGYHGTITPAGRIVLDGGDARHAPITIPVSYHEAQLLENLPADTVVDRAAASSAWTGKPAQLSVTLRKLSDLTLLTRVGRGRYIRPAALTVADRRASRPAVPPA